MEKSANTWIRREWLCVSICWSDTILFNTSEFLVLVPVGERTNKGVDKQLDQSFRCKQETNTNIFRLQEQTVLKTGGVLQKEGWSQSLVVTEQS